MARDLLLTELASCGSAESLLAAILKHLPDIDTPVLVEDIARRIGITDIRDMTEEGAISGLLVDGANATGIISC